MTAAAVPLRWPSSVVSVKLSMSIASVLRLAKDNVLTAIRTGPKGTGRRVYFLPDEVEAFATGGPEAVAKIKAQRKT